MKKSKYKAIYDYVSGFGWFCDYVKFDGLKYTIKIFPYDYSNLTEDVFYRIEAFSLEGLKNGIMNAILKHK